LQSGLENEAFIVSNSNPVYAGETHSVFAVGTSRALATR
jgi:hypothetical protein